MLKTLSSSAEEEVSNEKQFLAILEAIGQSFLQPDINVFKLNLATLQMLNTKWKLFHKVRFEVWGKRGSLQALHPVQCFFFITVVGCAGGGGHSLSPDHGWRCKKCLGFLWDEFWLS